MGSTRPLAPGLRRDGIRLSDEIAVRVRAGHPWIFRDALEGRTPTLATGALVDVTDKEGRVIGRGLYDAESSIAVRMLPGLSAGAPLDAAFIAKRLEDAIAFRRSVLPQAGSEITAYRLFSGESEGFPGFSVDRYGDYLHVQVFSAAAHAHRDLFYRVLTDVIAPKGIFEQKRLASLRGDAPHGPAELVAGERPPPPGDVEVREGDARYAVDLTAPQNVGLFPDLRLGRARVQALAAEKRVLNLFSYTGAFSVAAALGGAASITSVDLAAKVHSRTRENFKRSGIDPEASKEYFADEAIAALEKMAGKNRKFDIIVCDPPSFSQTKEGKSFVASRDWVELGRAMIDVLEVGGVLVACSNSYKVRAEELERHLGQAAGARATLQVIERLGLPADYPVRAGFAEGHYLTCVLLAKTG